MSRNSNGHGGDDTPNGRPRQYNRPSADYYEVIANGLRTPANDNGGSMSAKTKTLLKIAIPAVLLLALLALY